MVDKKYQNKAGHAELNNLHGLVADTLAKDLSDPKILALAIKFLKDNEITADIIESDEVKSLTQSIKDIASNVDSKVKELTVEEMLAL